MTIELPVYTPPPVGEPEDVNILIVKPLRMESIVRGVAAACSSLSFFIIFGILAVLFSQSSMIFSESEFNVREFLTGSVWQPVSGQFGLLPLLTATLVTSIIAMVVCIPLGVGTAIYLSEIATKRQRAVLKPTLELLATVPTVVYGFFALQSISPFIRGIFGPDIVQYQNMLSAGLAMGMMILPIVATMSEDTLRAVPYAVREASYGSGATRYETAVRAVLPAALSGISSAIILGFNRAIGETMIVALASGSGPNFTLNPFRSAETITGHIVRISGGELSYGSIEYRSMFLLALALLFVSWAIQRISMYLTKRYREAYQ